MLADDGRADGPTWTDEAARRVVIVSVFVLLLACADGLIPVDGVCSPLVLLMDGVRGATASLVLAAPFPPTVLLLLATAFVAVRGRPPSPWALAPAVAAAAGGFGTVATSMVVLVGDALRGVPAVECACAAVAALASLLGLCGALFLLVLLRPWSRLVALIAAWWMGAAGSLLTAMVAWLAVVDPGRISAGGYAWLGILAAWPVLAALAAATASSSRRLAAQVAATIPRTPVG